MTTIDPADQPDLDRVRGEMSRLHNSAPVTRRTEHDRLAEVRPDLAERLVRLEAEMRDLQPEPPTSLVGPLHEHVHISFEPGGTLEPREEDR